MNKKEKLYAILSMLIICMFVTSCGNKASINTNANISKPTSDSEELQISIDNSSEIANIDNSDEYILSYPISVTDNKKLTLKIYGRKLSNDPEQYGICEMEVFDGEKLIQNIKIEDAIVTEWGQDDYNGYTQSISKDGGLTTIDLNFDGFNDIGLVGWLPAGANTPYYYWLWNEEKQCFQYAFCLCNIEVDLENKQLISNTRDSANCYIIDYYKYDDNNQLQNIKQIVETIQEDGTVKSETYKVNNGELQTVE